MVNVTTTGGPSDPVGLPVMKPIGRGLDYQDIPIQLNVPIDLPLAHHLLGRKAQPERGQKAIIEENSIAPVAEGVIMIKPVLINPIYR